MRHTLPALLLLLSACTETGLNGLTGVDDPEACRDTFPARYEVRQDETCRGEPVVGLFEPTVGWQWRDNTEHPDFHQIMAAPAVGHLNDDDGDGVIGDGDVPDVVFCAFSGRGYRSPGALVALDGATGAQLWSVREVGGAQPYGAGGVAIADLGPGGPVVLTVSSGGLLAVEGHDGSHRWTAATPHSVYGHPAVADVDGDGEAEVVLGRNLVDTDGTVLWTGTEGEGRPMGGSFAVDLDEDGVAEIVAGRTVYEADGSVRWSVSGPDLWPAVGDLDLDGVPEIIGTDGAGHLYVLEAADGSTRWMLTLDDEGGGPPTVADFDGDGAPEIGIASQSYYRVVDGDGTVLWQAEVQDYSSRQTGSSVFDFEGDGAAEVVYADEETVWVYDGATGEVELAWEPHGSGTLYEYPLVVDVDADGAAEIVVASNDYSRGTTRGITILEDSSDTWAPARQAWNQHAWSITNADDDGRVPEGAPGNWTAWNSFRAGNSQTAVGLAQPNLRVGKIEACRLRCESADVVEVWISVENAGPGAAEPFFVAIRPAGSEERLVLDRVDGLQPGQTSWRGPFPLTRDDLTRALLVTADDADEVIECDEGDNYTNMPADLLCSDDPGASD